MSKGYLIINTTAAQRIIPVKDAKVTITNGEIISEFMSDESGRTPISEIDTPDIEFSESPDPSVRPFATVNVTASKEGFTTVNVQDVQIFPERTTTLYVNMIPIPEYGQDEGLDIIVKYQNL